MGDHNMNFRQNWICFKRNSNPLGCGVGVVAESSEWRCDMPALSTYRSEGDIVGRHCRNRMLKANIKRINLFEKKRWRIWGFGDLVWSYYQHNSTKQPILIWITPTTPKAQKKRKAKCSSSTPHHIISIPFP